MTAASTWTLGIARYPGCSSLEPLGKGKPLPLLNPTWSKLSSNRFLISVTFARRGPSSRHWKTTSLPGDASSAFWADVLWHRCLSAVFFLVSVINMPVCVVWCLVFDICLSVCLEKIKVWKPPSLASSSPPPQSWSSSNWDSPTFFYRLLDRVGSQVEPNSKVAAHLWDDYVMHWNL